MVPAAQSWQTERPVTPANFPAVQAVHAVPEPSAENVPSGHWVQPALVVDGTQ